jgi:hypothetical protein
MRRSFYMAALLVLVVLAPATAQQKEANESQNVVRLNNNTRLPGRVVNLHDGTLTLESPFFREPVQIVMEKIQSISFGQGEGIQVPDYVAVTNGDRIGGRVIEMTDGVVRMETRHMGTLDIPLVVVNSLARTGGSTYLLDADFTVRGIQDWEIVAGEWTVEDGLLKALRGGRPMSIAHKLDYRGPLTLRVEMTTNNSRGSYANVGLFAEGTDQQSDRLIVQISPHSFNVLVRTGGSYERVGSLPTRHLTGEQQQDITVAWDPAQRQITVWAGERKLDELSVPAAITMPEGDNLLLSCHAPQRFKMVRVTPAVVPPADAAQAEARPDRYVVALHNGDRFSASDVLLQGGQYTVETEMAELRLPADKVSRIVTPADGRHVPRRQIGDARAVLLSGVITLVPLELTGGNDGTLRGKPDYLDAVNIERDALRKLQMNIWE